MNKYKIISKDKQSIIKENMTELQVIHYWITYIAGTSSIYDYLIQTQDGKQNITIDKGHLVFVTTSSKDNSIVLNSIITKKYIWEIDII